MEKDIIRKYYTLTKKFNLLAEEVSYILKKLMKRNDIKISNISYRIKTLDSFLDKIQVKGYKNPFQDNTDFVGVRIVYIYKDDFSKIDKCIHDEFFVIEECSKIQDLGYDRFGYSAVHYLVKIHSKYNGARYEEIKDTICEIQVRTILQDAWALVSHHLEYKTKDDIPNYFKRELNSIAGTFELIDNQLVQIKEKRIEYIKEVNVNLHGSYLQMKINLDNLKEYLTNKFPKLPLETAAGVINIFPKMLMKYGYCTIQELDELLEKTITARNCFNKEETFGKSATRELFIALGLVHENAEEEFAIPNDRLLLNKYRHL